jgi:hypothetical protein
MKSIVGRASRPPLALRCISGTGFPACAPHRQDAGTTKNSSEQLGMSRGLRRRHEILVVWRFGPATQGPTISQAHPQGRQDRGINEKKPGTQKGLLARRGIPLVFPGFSRSRNLFQSSSQKVAEPSSGTFRGLLHCLGGRAGIYRRFRQSAPSQPLESSGQRPAFAWNQDR